MVVNSQKKIDIIHKCMFNKFIIIKENLINNIKQVATQNLKSKICAMVKANAYGVGINQVVKIIDKYVDFYGVACFFEAQNLKNFTKKKILIVGALEKNNIKKRFSYTCSCLEDVRFLKYLNRKINIHLKVNSGMNRFGFNSIEDFTLALKEIKFSKLNLEGVYTHFATDDSFVDVQMECFNKYVNVLKENKFFPIIHADNSVVNLKCNHHLNMVRVGFNLYGLNEYNFNTAIKICSKIVQINNVKKGELVGYNYKCVASKDLSVAVVPVGYADGFSIKLIGFDLYLQNKKCKVLNVCMDCFMLDVTNLNIKKGTEVPILDEVNSLTRYANFLGVSEYEVLTNFSYIRADKLIFASNRKDK